MSPSETKDALEELARALAGVPEVTLRFEVSGAKVTTFAIGGALPLVAEAGSTEAAATVVRSARAAGVPVRFLGAGSNLLVPDGGILALVVKLGGSLKKFERLGDRGVRAGGAVSLMALSRDLSTAGLSGLEFAGGIPASIGGAVRMNAGAHGGELCQVINSVTGCTGEGEIRRWSVADLQFSYRHCSLPPDTLVTEAELTLAPGDPVEIAERRAHHLAERKKRQPLQLPSAGSVFRNPSPDRTAGQLLESAGMKGESIGGAQVSELHANWIVNPRREASSADVAALIERCRDRVRQAHGMEIVPEIVRW